MRPDGNSDIIINSSIFWDKKPVHIAPMLIVIFVENAFKYGISFHRTSIIEIHITVENGPFHLMVRNSLLKGNSGVSNGLGLENTRKRLELLYSGKYTLDENQDEILHEVNLNINLIYA